MENNDTQIEQEIQAKGKTAPRITPADLQSAIRTVHYFTAAQGVQGTMPPGCEAAIPAPLTLLTFCVLVLQNGFTVTGESACASPENFDAEIGRQIARQNAEQKIWPLMGYELKSELHRRAQFDAEPKVGMSVSVSHAPGNLDAMARIAHEVNRAYCAALGDTSQPAWEDAPEWQRSSARMGVELHTMGDFGPEASHISWMSQKLSEGWVYGPVKDPELKQHPCIVPFADLPREQQAKDFIFRAVVHALK